MKTAKPHGKGLTGFIVGLLLATVIIGGLVYTLESSRKRDFKAPIEEKELTPPEILSPKKPEPKPEPQQPASEAKPEPEPLPPDSGRTTDRETPEQPEPDSAPDNGKEPDAADDSDIIPGVPSPLTEEGKNGKKDQTRRDQKRRDKAKPTPEQILNGKIGTATKNAPTAKPNAAKPKPPSAARPPQTLPAAAAETAAASSSRPAPTAAATKPNPNAPNSPPPA
ncbi:hypothetical protein [Kingella potus]|uniref:hypothetical protein n=1 Tax=Kingella potus TaxID=265175 RepID=UPI001FD15BDB|nr:hypothetical protein [Kingella potus]UOP01446.1 hypothetical protein LVJ84_04360 [Kingella potus]